MYVYIHLINRIENNAVYNRNEIYNRMKSPTAYIPRFCLLLAKLIAQKCKSNNEHNAHRSTHAVHVHGASMILIRRQNQ